jgi:acetyltransferase-like isoleucine patch superfamily enzyme
MNKEERHHQTVVDTLKTESGSPSRKYQDIYIGEYSFFALLKYELLMSLFAPLPGAAGFILRKIFFKKLFKKIGGGTVLGRNINLRCPGQISIGNDFVADNNVVLDAKGGDSSITIGNSVFVGNNTIFSCSSANINMKNNISIGPNCYIRASRGDISLGSYITIGAQTVIISGNPDYKRLDIPMMYQDGEVKGISVGNDVWMGVGVRIIDGVKIGSGCVIGAGAVVTKDIPDFTIAAGIPAKVIAKRKND